MTWVFFFDQKNDEFSISANLNSIFSVNHINSSNETKIYV
jgi:hypothetical protein